MRLLLLSDAGDLSLTTEFVGQDTIPPYAILSHTWAADVNEYSYADLANGTGKNKLGYKKVLSCGDQARQDGLYHFWVDTCCINRENSTELAYSINSMFRWYHNATLCYVYLADTNSLDWHHDQGLHQPSWAGEFAKSRWFTRGWTLQELLAPQSVEFFSSQWKRLGNKRSLEQQIHQITGIPELALQNAPLSQFGIQERLSWATHRCTKREEDEAYSLLGIFNVSMSLIYGEGKERAFKRLLEEIHKSSISSSEEIAPVYTPQSTPWATTSEESSQDFFADNLDILYRVFGNAIFGCLSFRLCVGEISIVQLYSIFIGGGIECMIDHHVANRLPFVLRLLRAIFIHVIVNSIIGVLISRTICL